MMNFHGAFWLWGLFNLGLLLIWIVLSIVALIDLRGRKLPASAKALWTLIVLVIPILGAAALFIVNPTDTPPAAE